MISLDLCCCLALTRTNKHHERSRTQTTSRSFPFITGSRTFQELVNAQSEAGGVDAVLNWTMCLAIELLSKHRCVDSFAEYCWIQSECDEHRLQLKTRVHSTT